MQSITLYGAGGPNPPKVAIVLNELGLAFETIAIPLSDVKSESYTALNPNGRLPTITDPNTGITIWESGAIVEYLVETYDKDHKISFEPGTSEYFHAKQWLFFQVSGQAPYYGQAIWFKKFHHERLPSAIDRYTKEIHRVTGVLEKWLEDRSWLVGEEFSYADLSFFIWQGFINVRILGKDEFDPDQYPNVKRWMQSMREREAIKKVCKDMGVEL